MNFFAVCATLREQEARVFGPSQRAILMQQLRQLGDVCGYALSCGGVRISGRHLVKVTALSRYL
jgi:hypothetical protein